MRKTFTIYLDIDGVLAPYAYFARLKILAKNCVEHFNFIMNSLPSFDFDVCVISNWCSLFEPTELKNIFYHYGVNINKITTFRHIDVGISREDFVKKDVNTNNIINYVVIDDEFDKIIGIDSDKVITPKSRVGLSNEDVAKFLNIQKGLQNETIKE